MIKPLFIIFFFNSVLVAKPLTLKLNYKENAKNNYSHQIQKKFAKLLVRNSNLAKKFKKFKSPPARGVRGRYSGDPVVQSIVISESENVNYREKMGTTEFQKTIALYYRFDEGMRRGKETDSGFFALFTVSGNLIYSHLKNGKWELKKSDVIAQFNGFSRTLVAPSPEKHN